MAFQEYPRFPEGISIGSRFGPGYLTRQVINEGGFDHSNQVHAAALYRGDVSHGIKNQAQLDELLNIFHVQAGRHHGFRFKNWNDYLVTLLNGRLGIAGAITAAAVGSGVPGYRMFKRHSNAGGSRDKEIRKPVTGTGIIYRNDVAVTQGVAAGNCSIDYANGDVTFVADDSEAITGHTPGASHVFTTAADIPGLAIGEKVYLTGVTGTAATTLNSIAHTISNKTGAGPYTWTVSTTTTGLTASGGTGYEYPQTTDTLKWAGEFDFPVKFGTDVMMPQWVDFEIYDWAPIPIREIRIP